MKPLCSFLVPSRFRFTKLIGLLDSIYAASSEDDFEIVIRFHRDDEESLGRVGELSRFPNAKFFMGDTLDGYNSLHIFTAELIEHAQGRWAWHFNDDMVLKGKGWEKQLRETPLNALVQPEIHQLNESLYFNDKGGSAPCHANTPDVAEMLRAINMKEIDLTIYNYFASRSTTVRFLKGITVHHQWEGVASHAF